MARFRDRAARHFDERRGRRDVVGFHLCSGVSAGCFQTGCFKFAIARVATHLNRAAEPVATCFAPPSWRKLCAPDKAKAAVNFDGGLSRLMPRSCF
jgi:hypothetical protein